MASDASSYEPMINGLVLGDVIELPSLAPGLSCENVVATLVGISGDRKVFELYWHEVRIGKVCAIKKKGGMEFKEVI